MNTRTKFWLWKAISEAFFFVSSDAIFEGCRLISSARAYHHPDKLEFINLTDRTLHIHIPRFHR